MCMDTHINTISDVKCINTIRRTFNMRLVVCIGIDSPITTAALQYRDSELVGQ